VIIIFAVNLMENHLVKYHQVKFYLILIFFYLNQAKHNLLNSVWIALSHYDRDSKVKKIFI